MPESRHILVLSHEQDAEVEASGYLIRFVAAAWREMGHTVTFQRGVDSFTPADLVMVHIDLTEAPQEYLDFAAQYPRSINGEFSSNAKDLYSGQAIDRRSSYRGPVMVKTRLNYGGVPEAGLRHQGGDSLVGLGVGERPWAKVEYLDSNNYPVFDSPMQVPPGVWRNPNLIVEKFLPETDDSGNFYARGWYFLGESSLHFHIRSTRKVVKDFDTEEEKAFFRASVADPEFQAQQLPEKLQHVRERLHAQWGMMDWGLHQGEPVIYDVNKTPAVFIDQLDDPVYLEHIMNRGRILARGLAQYLD